MGISHTIFKKNKIELALDVDDSVFELTLGHGFCHCEDEDCGNTGIAELSLSDMVKIHKELGELLDFYKQTNAYYLG